MPRYGYKEVDIMDTIRCRAFLTTVEEGTVKGAAKKMGYTPSAISQLITSLENDLEVQLLDRGRKGSALTVNGKKILPKVRALLDQEEQLYQTAADINGLLAGSITIGSFTSIATFWLPQLLQSFQEQYPNIDIHLQEGPVQDIYRWLDNREVDICFCSDLKVADYEWIPLGEDRMVVVLSKDHHMAKEKKFPISQLRYENIILPQQGGYSNAVKMLEKRGIPYHVRLTTYEVYASMAMAEQGLGVTILNELITRSLKGSAVIIPIDPPYNIKLGIAVPGINEASPATKCFIKHTIEKMKSIE